jgi:hypothetical protein
MKKELNYLASKRLEKVWQQELRSTPYKQEINRWFSSGKTDSVEENLTLQENITSI